MPWTNEAAPTTIFGPNWWDYDSDERRPVRVGNDTRVFKFFKGDLPPGAQGPLIGTEDEWLHGLSFEKWVAGGYVNPNGCWPVVQPVGGAELGGGGLEPEPGGLEVSGGPGTYSSSGPIVGVGTLAAGGGADITLVLAAGAAGLLTNSGQGDAQLTTTVTAAGEAEASGAGDTLLSLPVVAAGHVWVWGVAGEQIVLPVTVIGHLETSGGADVLSVLYAHAGIGGTAASGEADVDEVPGLTEDYVLLATSDFSNAGTVDLTGLTGYDWYLLVAWNLQSSSGAVPDLYLRTSTDGGSNYDAGSTDYQNGFSTAAQLQTIGLAQTGTNSHTGTLKVYMPGLNGPSLHKLFLWEGLKWDGSSLSYGNSTTRALARLTTSAVDAVRLLGSTGNIYGKVRVYGY